MTLAAAAHRPKIDRQGAIYTVKCHCGFDTLERWILCRISTDPSGFYQVDILDTHGRPLACGGEYLSTEKALDFIVETAMQHNALPHFHFETAAQPHPAFFPVPPAGQGRETAAWLPQ